MLPREKVVPDLVDSIEVERFLPAHGIAGDDKDKEVVVIAIHLSPELQQRAAAKAVGVDGNQTELRHRSQIRDSFPTQLAAGMKVDIHMDAPHGRTYVGVISRGLADYLLKNYCVQHYRSRDAKGGLPTKRLHSVLRYIDSHLHEEISIDTLARLVYFSPYYFIKLFKESMGETPHKFILRKRMERANHLLRKSDKPISQIAVDVGYNYACNFSSAFKQFTGISPIDYRRSFRLVDSRARCVIEKPTLQQ